MVGLRSTITAATVSLLVLASPLAAMAAHAASAGSPTERKATCQGKKATIVSSAAVVKGTDRADVIVLNGAGRHVVNAGGGDDIVCGSPGVDIINAGPGDDVVSGGAGDDVQNGGTGDDVVSGGPGDDTQGGGPGDDKAYGNAGDDEQSGGTGTDTLNGGAGEDSLDGNEGEDTYNGGDGEDTTYDDGTDRHRGDGQSEDTRRDDSRYQSSSIPAEIRAALNSAGLYLTAGLANAEVGGNGFQSVLPEVPSMGASPKSALVTAVMWHSNDQEGNKLEADLCLEATSGDTLVFKYRSELRGDETKSRLSTGRCMTEPTAPQIPADLQAILTLGAKHMIAAGDAGVLGSAGDQVALPQVPGSETPSSPYIKRVTWMPAKASRESGGDGSYTVFCIAATMDDANWFRAVGRIAGDRTGSAVQPGDCQRPSDVPALSKATGDFLQAARDYMAAGIAIGSITGSGDQTAFPSVAGQDVPSGASPTRVRWLVGASVDNAASASRSEDDRTEGRFCVAATDSGSGSSFQVMARTRGDGRAESRITPGNCGFADESPEDDDDEDVPDEDAVDALRDISDYMKDALEEGDLTGTGARETLDGLDPELAEVLIRATWNATLGPDGEDLARGNFCVAVRGEGGRPLQMMSEYRPDAEEWTSSPAMPGECAAPPPARG